MTGNKIYKLTPCEEHLNDPKWSRSKYKGEAIVVSPNENLAWGFVIRLNGEQDIVPSMQVKDDNPWGDRKLIRCEEIKDPSIDTSKARLVSPETH